MKSAVRWFEELRIPFDGDITIQDIIRIQEDAAGLPAMNKPKNPAAVALGRLGGSVKSEAKKRAAKQNILKRWAKAKKRGQ